MYWRNYDITFQADDVVWAGFRPSTDNLISNITDLSYIKANIDIAASIVPTLTVEKTINLFDEEILSPYTVYPLVVIGPSGAACLQPTVISDTPLLKLLVEQMLSPAAIESAYIESDTKASIGLFPTLDNVLEASLFDSEELIANVDSIGLIACLYGDDSLQPILISQGTSTILQETILKRLNVSWAEVIIYMKEFDGTWSSKPIYMKQIDKSWM
jgi:hypothetical protein